MDITNFIRSQIARLTYTLLLAIISIEAIADELRMSVDSLWDESVAVDVVRDKDGGALILDSGVLYEDDGPAAGYSYRPNVETLQPNVQIKKQLMIDRPSARTATLLVGQGGEIGGRINDQHSHLQFSEKVGNYWRAYQFSPTLLKTGMNEFTLFASSSSSQQGHNRPRVWIARDDEFANGAADGRKPPNRSRKSTDNGVSWRDSQLGDSNNVDGEYYVRVYLDQYRATGTLTLPVIDLANLGRLPISPPVSELRNFSVEPCVSGESIALVKLAMRFGPTSSTNADSWTGWREFNSHEAKISSPLNRFAQVKINLQSDDPQRTPRLTGIRLRCETVRPQDWTSTWKISASDNPPIVRSPLKFVHESFDEPQLKKLREQERLDDVVRGARTQFETACRLAVWSSTRWQKLGHLKETYPPWNSLKILEKHPDGTAIGGFCQQFSLVFLQACLSFGINARAVSVGPGNLVDRLRSGHETVEIWSNEYRKWIYLDGNKAWYFRDRSSAKPLSLWEVRLRQLSELTNGSNSSTELVSLVPSRFEEQSLTSSFGFVELRYLPRNNFLSQPTPIPLNQGMRGWFWPDHWATGDELNPPTMLYHHHFRRQKDAEWTLNQANILLTATATPNELQVHLDSETPGFESYLVKTDQDTEREEKDSFIWRLHAGKNRLEVVTRNCANQRGVLSSLEIVER